MKSLKLKIYSLLLTLVFLTSCYTTIWKDVTEPTLHLYSKNLAPHGQKLFFVIANPLSETKQFIVICRDKATGADSVVSDVIEVGPHRDKMISLLYPFQMLARSISCTLLED